MSLPVLVFLVATLITGWLAVFLSVKEEKTKKLLQEQEKQQKQRLYEITILKSIQDRIGYSLDIERVIDTLTGSLKNIFSYSTASSLIVKDDTLLFKMNLEEAVGQKFIDQVKNSMLASLASLSETPLSNHTEDVITGVAIDNTNQALLASFFHIPLIVHGKVVGLINVSSTKPGLYKEKDMTIFYQMTQQASGALSKLEEVITTEESRLLALIGSMTDGIFMIDDQNRLTLINDTAKKLLHISKDDVTIFDIVGSLAHAYDFGAKIQQVKEKNQAIAQDEFILGEKTIQVFISPVRGALTEADYLKGNTQKKVIGISVLLHDVTLEKEIETMKQDFTNAIVHELRSPLTAIKASASLIETSGDKMDKADEEKMIHTIHEEAKRMIAEIGSLLDAAKLDTGKFTINATPNDIKKTLTDTIDLFLPESKEKHINLTLEIASDLPKANIDTTRIAQVLNNFISNSMKFTPSGGKIIVTAKLYENDHLPQTPTNPGILISVADTGVGIPKEKQSMLFSKFSQAHGSELSKAGSGLGLYIAKGIVEAHKGAVYLNSMINEGTTISFTLPLAKEENKATLHDDQQTPQVPKSSLGMVIN